MPGPVISGGSAGALPGQNIQHNTTQFNISNPAHWMSMPVQYPTSQRTGMNPSLASNWNFNAPGSSNTLQTLANAVGACTSNPVTEISSESSAATEVQSSRNPPNPHHGNRIPLPVPVAVTVARPTRSISREREPGFATAPQPNNTTLSLFVGSPASGLYHQQPTSSLLRGIDSGDQLTPSGRRKRARSLDNHASDLNHVEHDQGTSDSTNVDVRRSDESIPLVSGIQKVTKRSLANFRARASHIHRAFDLYSHIPTIINKGIRRQARYEAGISYEGIQCDRDFETFQLILSHLIGLDKEIIRLQNSPAEFRALVLKIKEGADNARNNDNAGLKRDVLLFLSHDCGTAKVLESGQQTSSKHDRGFQNDIIGRFLCPSALDWDDELIRRKIRSGEIAIKADNFPLLLYANCRFNPDDLEEGLGRNLTLVSTVKYIFTGRSSAFKTTAGGKTTRTGNAEIAGMTAVTPRVIAYGACLLRFALSTQESWNKYDGDFNMEEFYWNVVDIFCDGDDFSKDLLSWWNQSEIFGTSLEKVMHSTATSVTTTSSLSVLKAQRAAKRARTLAELDINSQSY